MKNLRAEHGQAILLVKTKVSVHMGEISYSFAQQSQCFPHDKFFFSKYKNLQSYVTGITPDFSKEKLNALCCSESSFD